MLYCRFFILLPADKVVDHHLRRNTPTRFPYIKQGKLPMNSRILVVIQLQSCYWLIPPNRLVAKIIHRINALKIRQLRILKSCTLRCVLFPLYRLYTKVVITGYELTLINTDSHFEYHSALTLSSARFKSTGRA